MALAKVVSQALAAQVKIAVLETEILVGEFFIELKGENLRFVDDGEVGSDDLDFAGGELGIGGVGLLCLESGCHFSGDLNDVFITKAVRKLGRFLGIIRAEDHLGETLAVAHVDEDHAAVVAGRIHPTDEGDSFADVLRADFVTVVRSH